MLLLDVSFLETLEDELVSNRWGRAADALVSRSTETVIISVVTLADFARDRTNLPAFARFISHFRRMPLSPAVLDRALWLRTVAADALQGSTLWVAATALAHGATVVTRIPSFAAVSRWLVPELRYCSF
jgi:predicted nucleic acid-binding protein